MKRVKKEGSIILMYLLMVMAFYLYRIPITVINPRISILQSFIPLLNII